MTSGSVMLGARTSVVNSPGGTNGYAPAFGRTERILSRVTSLGNVTSHLACLLT
eukprot:CAMPEP_0202941832 /NCGR_PEP_ID=MMETSP1395-20130829/1971_1 /ASSEMBLY_ACC=CAM_ASM_000871 /TAXON_ID=5961 /ORGANISM="Blepharisma japonicum, Strain Stock R1072" /LENGTH=53 /DNA_ID=CAMNT_0049637441 /DNA_START=103 /DNA_END=264 /DNA_ORIENTATION=+